MQCFSKSCRSIAVWEHHGGAAQEITSRNSKMAIDGTERRAGDLVLSFRRR